MKGNMIFAERIKKLRELKGESQVDLANLVGYQKQAVSHWENSGKVPRTHILEILAEHYQTTSDFLLGFRINNMPPALEPEQEISSDEMQLLKRYRMMADHQKETIQQVAETIVPLGK